MTCSCFCVESMDSSICQSHWIVSSFNLMSLQLCCPLMGSCTPLFSICSWKEGADLMRGLHVVMGAEAVYLPFWESLTDIILGCQAAGLREGVLGSSVISSWLFAWGFSLEKRGAPVKSPEAGQTAGMGSVCQCRCGARSQGLTHLGRQCRHYSKSTLGT